MEKFAKGVGFKHSYTVEKVTIKDGKLICLTIVIMSPYTYISNSMLNICNSKMLGFSGLL